MSLSGVTKVIYVTIVEGRGGGEEVGLCLGILSCYESQMFRSFIPVANS